MPLLFRLLPSGPPREKTAVWVDVGAHMGQSNLLEARRRRDCMFFAFEPNIKAISHAFALLDNYVVVPMAVTETDGFTKMYLNNQEETSSTLQLNELGLRNWQSVKPIKPVSQTVVPTIRLDTFMRLMDIPKIDFLKIDTQGGDLAVVRSAGNRIEDIKEIQAEVQLTGIPLYVGAPTKDTLVDYMLENGFRLVEVSKQSFGQEENLTFRREN